MSLLSTLLFGKPNHGQNIIATAPTFTTIQPITRPSMNEWISEYTKTHPRSYIMVRCGDIILMDVIRA